jgi:hypothetical protein
MAGQGSLSKQGFQAQTLEIFEFLGIQCLTLKRDIGEERYKVDGLAVTAK